MAHRLARGGHPRRTLGRHQRRVRAEGGREASEFATIVTAVPDTGQRTSRGSCSVSGRTSPPRPNAITRWTQTRAGRSR